MVRPIILGAAASSNLLDGMKNQIRLGLHPQLQHLFEMSLVNRRRQLCQWIVDKQLVEQFTD